jgi:RNA polymerase sigma-70 factor (ECF subfamily)
MIKARLDDRSLLEALKSSDRHRRDRGYECLVDGHAGYLMQLLTRFGAQPAEAEDLLQEVFIKVLRAIPQFAGSSSLRTWLRRIAVNIWIDLLRQRKARPAGVSITEPESEDGEAMMASLESHEPDALQAAALLQFEECLEQAFAEFERRHPAYAATLRAEVTLDPAPASQPAASKSGSERQRLYEARTSLDVFTRHCRSE